MKNLFTIAFSLAIGIAIGVAATFKAAEKKAGEMIEEELAEFRRSAREAESEDAKEEADTSESSDEDETESSDLFDAYNEISDEYAPAKKPYILEEMPKDFAEKHKFLKDFEELNVVYDRNRGRVADEDGCEVVNFNSTMGITNLNKLHSKYEGKACIHIVCEQEGMIFLAHAGNLYEYLDEPEDDYYD